MTTSLRRTLVVVSLLSLGWLGACGQKGDLYLPDPEPIKVNF